MNHRGFTDGLWQCKPRDRSVYDVQDSRSVKHRYDGASSLGKETADNRANSPTRVENAD
jgi:hypothetical protein